MVGTHVTSTTKEGSAAQCFLISAISALMNDTVVSSETLNAVTVFFEVPFKRYVLVSIHETFLRHPSDPTPTVSEWDRPTPMLQRS